MPREILLKKVPFPLPNPEIFNLDQILAATTDTVVSENGEFKEFSLWLIIFSFSPFCDLILPFLLIFMVGSAALTFNDLEIVPHKLKGYPIEFLIQYRKGGPQFGSTVSEKVSPDAWP
jgi:NADH dehydrogenase (ubiquinone) 1 alpha subcomplex subunit 9